MKNACAIRPCSRDRLRSTLRGWGAPSRRHKAGCVIDASLPSVLAGRHSSSPVHGKGSQGVKKSHSKHNERNISAGRVGSFVSRFPSMAFFLLLAVVTSCRAKELLALRRQDSVQPNRHTMEPWSLLISTSGTQDCKTPASGYPVDAIPTENPTRHPGASFVPSPEHEVKHIAQRLGVEDRITPCQTRHSGPSIGRAGTFRTWD